jgi:hypothetical protein
MHLLRRINILSSLLNEKKGWVSGIVSSERSFQQKLEPAEGRLFAFAA